MSGATSKRDGSRLSVSQLPACAGFGRDKKRKGLLDWYFNSRASAPKPHEGALARTTPMRIEPKTFFANERTFLSWCARLSGPFRPCLAAHCCTAAGVPYFPARCGRMHVADAGRAIVPRSCLDCFLVQRNLLQYGGKGRTTHYIRMSASAWSQAACDDEGAGNVLDMCLWCVSQAMVFRPMYIYLSVSAGWGRLHMAVTLGSIAAALLGFAGVAQRGEGAGHEARRQHPLLGPVHRVNTVIII